MNKNPFEIRTEILTLAVAHCKAQYEANLTFARVMIEEFTKAGKDVADVIEKYLPQYPTVADIIAEARNMSKFVDKQ